MNATVLSRQALFIAGLALVPGLARAELDAPISGWRQGNPDAPFTQAVNYPAVTPGIDGDTPAGSQIRGRIAVQAKPDRPATLIVNGNAMPMRLDANGAFARPYSFGAGSNGVEVRVGNERLRTQFYQSANGQPESRLRIVLSWDTDGTDLDLHVITPSGQHAWYGQRVIDSGAIDIDVTTGYGPEIFAAPAPEKGLYQVYINYYGGGGDGNDDGDGNGNIGLTVAHLTVISNEGTLHEKRQEFSLPMRFSGELILARQFMYP
jgi:uncharacterized protein YfaP (DUF2135 family)